jgi:predicted enzyme related to lactoylglutathione lyase
MTMTAQHPEPFGIAAVSDDMEAAREFYTKLYPYPVTEGVFAGINYLSIMKDGATLVNVFQKSEQNPIKGMIPILKVESVAEYMKTVEALGGTVIIPEALCPCTNASFALCTDSESNQFMIKEPTRG